MGLAEDLNEAVEGKVKVCPICEHLKVLDQLASRETNKTAGEDVAEAAAIRRVFKSAVGNKRISEILQKYGVNAGTPATTKHRKEHQ